MKKTMITGVRPTGKLTLANYIGGMKNFIEMQNDYDSYIFIADIHGVTTYIEPSEIQKNILDICALYLACGINTDKTTLFLQSEVLEHANLGYLLSYQCSVGELSRMTQYKAKRNENKNEKDLGLFIYPTLMAADILIYDADVVPVGKDQRQHIEITRDIGERFNKIYGNTFKLPEYSIPKIGAKIMNLQKTSEKMNKSAPINDKGTIFLLDDIEITRKKIMSSTTDSENKIYFDEVNKPGISNLISIISVIQNKDIKQIENDYIDFNYKDFKVNAADIICDFIKEIQINYESFRKDENNLKDILSKGSIQAKIKANKKLMDVKTKIGINLN